MSDPFDALNMASRNLFNAGQVEAQANRIEKLERRIEALREAGDQLWYCIRHAKRIDAEEVSEAVEDWQEARNNG